MKSFGPMYPLSRSQCCTAASIPSATLQCNAIADSLLRELHDPVGVCSTIPVTEHADCSRPTQHRTQRWLCGGKDAFMNKPRGFRDLYGSEESRVWPCLSQGG